MPPSCFALLAALLYITVEFPTSTQHCLGLCLNCLYFAFISRPMPRSLPQALQNFRNFSLFDHAVCLVYYHITLILASLPWLFSDSNGDFQLLLFACNV